MRAGPAHAQVLHMLSGWFWLVGVAAVCCDAEAALHMARRVVLHMVVGIGNW